MSEKIDDGGRAFPGTPHYERVGDTQHFYEGAYGMSMRAYIATAIAAGLVASGNRRDVAKDAVIEADALLLELSK